MPQLPGVEHRLVDVAGVRFHVAEAGEGDPLVLLHGWPQNWWEWRRLIPLLSDRYRVICLDTRGSGWSDAPKGGYDRETMARDVIGVLDQLGIDRFRMVGHDVRVLVGRYRSMRLTVPTLMLHGTEDKILREPFLRGFEPYADDMALELVPNAGHFIAHEKPELVADRVLAFFRQ